MSSLYTYIYVRTAKTRSHDLFGLYTGPVIGSRWLLQVCIQSINVQIVSLCCMRHVTVISSYPIILRWGLNIYSTLVSVNLILRILFPMEWKNLMHEFPFCSCILQHGSWYCNIARIQAFEYSNSLFLSFRVVLNHQSISRVFQIQIREFITWIIW